MTVGVIMYVMGGVFALLAAIGAVGTVRQVLKRKRSKAWPIAAGRVTASDVKVETRTERDDNGGTRTVQMYGARVGYSYSVAGVAYEGHLVDWIDGVETSLEAPARKVVEKYPVGQLVNVYYDPVDPKMAILEPWRIKGILLLILFTVAFGVAGAVLLWFAPTAK